jgi:pentatricopeptide repeat protein
VRLIVGGQVTYNNMLDAYAKAGLFNKAEALIEEMRAQGHPPNSVTYLLLISAYIKENSGVEAEAILQRMREQGIEPDIRHYNGVILAYGKAWKVKEAERIFAELKSVALMPDLACYRTMMKIYLDRAYFREGLALYEELRTFSELDGNLYSVVVDLYIGAGKELEANEMLNELKSKGYIYKGKHGPLPGSIARVWRRSNHAPGAVTTI